MEKTRLGARVALYPLPIVLVGALVGERPNYLTVAYCGIVQHDPPMLAVSLSRGQYTTPGVRERGTFSVNVPSTDMVRLVDHCGIVSGRSEDKAALFTTFYGDLETAPMIAECAVNLECRVVAEPDLPGANALFIGEIVQVHADPRCLRDDVPDIKRINPILFAIHQNVYWRLGQPIGEAWSIGRHWSPPRD